ncbi:unnamed protein product [Chironomus riparius]|uniref:Uncharacterized protein n=1 Tax=Chironomus riparius TaxID=315576 RepID=A0A9N9WYQ6_9DIPT|nr:unnamed protein product [Chironomus riparius]
MSIFKTLIICCLIYQTKGGAPSNDCISCKDVLFNLASPSPWNCNPGTGRIFRVLIVHKPEAGMADVQGACINFLHTDPINPLIDEHSSDITIES